MTSLNHFKLAKEILFALTTLAFAGAGFVCLWLGVTELWRGRDLPVVGVSLTAGLLFLLAGSIDRFEVLKGMGVEARTRKTLEETITRATATVDQLREVATVVSHLALTDLMAGNFTATMPTAKRLQLHSMLIGSLKELGLSTSQMVKVEENWHKGFGLLYFGIIRTKLIELESKRSANPLTPRHHVTAEFDKLLNYQKWETPSPDMIITFLEGHGLLTQEIRQWAEDLRYYQTNRALRRVDEFTAEIDPS